MKKIKKGKETEKVAFNKLLLLFLFFPLILVFGFSTYSKNVQKTATKGHYLVKYTSSDGTGFEPRDITGVLGLDDTDVFYRYDQNPDSEFLIMTIGEKNEGKVVLNKKYKIENGEVVVTENNKIDKRYLDDSLFCETEKDCFYQNVFCRVSISNKYASFVGFYGCTNGVTFEPLKECGKNKYYEVLYTSKLKCNNNKCQADYKFGKCIDISNGQSVKTWPEEMRPKE